MATAFTLTFHHKEKIAQHAYSFYFKRIPDFDFHPGQYIRISLPIATPDAKGTSRFFTIASSPTEDDYIMITTEQGVSSFKQTLFSLQEGQQVQFFGPSGRFIFDPTDTRHHIFLAGGIGITPYHSIIHYAYDTQLTTPMTLFTSWRKPEEIPYKEKLTKIKEEGNWLTYVPTVTRKKESNYVWSGETGRISKELIMKYVPNVMNALFFITGQPLMVDAMEQLVKEMNVPEEQIKVEKYTGY